MEQVLGRWPNVPLSERAVVAALRDLRKFHILVNERPLVEVSSQAITSVCEQHGTRNPVDTLKEILIFQPNTMVTAEMFLAMADPGG